MTTTEQKLQKKKENNECPFDLVGQKKGTVTILRVSDTKYERKDNGKTVSRWQYDCVCDCNPEKVFQLNRDRLTRKDEENIQCPDCGRKKIRKPLFQQGQKIGHLTLVKQAPHRGKHIQWYCSCDCGNSELIIRSNDFLSNKDPEKIHCGCLSETEEHTIGNIINQWKILEIIYDENGRERYKCVCTCGCGEEKNVANFYDNFCQKRMKEEQEKLETARIDKKILPVPEDMNDLTGQKYGFLEIIGFGGFFKHARYWWAKCSCGTWILNKENMFTTKVTYSCGCIKSKGEFRIAQFLTENNINYVGQKKFRECYYYRELPFDFYVQNPKDGKWFLIEFQGIQHFQPIKYCESMTDEDALKNFKKLKKRDKIKKDFCEKTGTELLEITYLDFPEIENILVEKLGLNLSDEK